MDKADFEDWLDLPITKDFMAWVEQNVNATKEAWLDALWSNGPDCPLVQQRARLSERLVLLKEIANVDYEDVYGEQERDSPE